jgi:hypothetical protein
MMSFNKGGGRLSGRSRTDIGDAKRLSVPQSMHVGSLPASI